MGPPRAARSREARDARLELVISTGSPEGVRVHLKLEPGWAAGGSPSCIARREVVGLMSHFASADSDAAFTEQQIERFRAATRAYRTSPANREQRRRTAVSLSRFDAARCGIALYGISPFGTDPTDDGLEPGRWDTELAQVSCCSRGATGYGRRWIAERPTWIGIVPVGTRTASGAS